MSTVEYLSHTVTWPPVRHVDAAEAARVMLGNPGTLADHPTLLADLHAAHTAYQLQRNMIYLESGVDVSPAAEAGALADALARALTTLARRS